MPSALDDPTLLDQLAAQAAQLRAARDAPEAAANQPPRQYASSVSGAPEAGVNQLPPPMPAPVYGYGAPEADINQLAPMRQASPVAGAPEGVQTDPTGMDRDLEGQRARAYRGGPAPPGSALGAEGAAAGLEPVDPSLQPPGPIESWLKRQRRFVKDKEPEMPKEAPFTSGGALTSDPRQFEAVLPPMEGKPGAPTTVTSAPAGAEQPVKTEAPKPSAPPKKRQMYGAPAASATQGDQPVPMTPRASIHPRAYVDLAQSNPGLYTAITEAAATADVGAWDLTNVMMAASGGRPDADKDGRIGLTGLTREDIAKYQQRYPELFQEGRGPEDPATNLILGALKLKEKYAEFGTRTNAALAAYHKGSDVVNAASRLPPKDQQTQLGPDTYNFVAQATTGSTTAPEKAPTPTMTGAGTGTPQGYAQAAVAAARAGNSAPFTTYAVRSAPAGMSTTDLWRQAQFSLEMAFLSKGSIEGAQRAREMVFQQSQVGSTQELMKAHAAMRLGDEAGMATHLARAYFHAPDGGQAQFTVTKNGVWGQRYNEHNGDPVGKPFKVTEEGIMSMLNVTQDPQAYAKHVREEQKSLAELADKKSLARWRDVTQPMIAAGHDATRIATNAASNARATEIAEANRNEATRRTLMQQQGANARTAQQQAGEWGRLGYKSQADYDRAMDVAGLRQPGGAAGAPTDKQINDEIGTDAMALGIGAPDKVTPAFQKYGAYYDGLRRTGSQRPQAQAIAQGLTAGKYGMRSLEDGRVAIVDPKNPNVGIAYLPAGTLGRVGIGTAPATTPPAATAAPAAGR